MTNNDVPGRRSDRFDGVLRDSGRGRQAADQGVRAATNNDVPGRRSDRFDGVLRDSGRGRQVADQGDRGATSIDDRGRQVDDTEVRAATNIAVLGCTGSIGAQTLNVARRHPNRFRISFLANGSDSAGLVEIAREFGVEDFFCAAGLWVERGVERPFDPNALARPETYLGSDIVVNGISGLDGLEPSIAVLSAKKTLATANKESLACGGEFLNRILGADRSALRPIDSEHSTVWQCAPDMRDVRKIVLTASGGAFRDYSQDMLKAATAADALRHPTWKMGRKVTIDCATMANKGLEIIEAKRLFGIDAIEVAMHRESIVHSLVEMKDGTMIAGLSNPSMEVPIQYALTYPERIDSGARPLDLVEIGTLNFGPVDREKFPVFALCEEAALHGDYAGTVLCAADEVAADRFFRGEIGYFGVRDAILSAFERFGLSGRVSDAREIRALYDETKAYLS